MITSEMMAVYSQLSLNTSVFLFTWTCSSEAPLITFKACINGLTYLLTYTVCVSGSHVAPRCGVAISLHAYSDSSSASPSVSHSVGVILNGVSLLLCAGAISRTVTN